jgi:hypothetical protein
MSFNFLQNENKKLIDTSIKNYSESIERDLEEKESFKSPRSLNKKTEILKVPLLYASKLEVSISYTDNLNQSKNIKIKVYSGLEGKEKELIKEMTSTKGKFSDSIIFKAQMGKSKVVTFIVEEEDKKIGETSFYESEFVIKKVKKELKDSKYKGVLEFRSVLINSYKEQEEKLELKKFENLLSQTPYELVDKTNFYSNFLFEGIY